MLTISKIEQEVQNLLSPFFDCNIYYTTPESVVWESEKYFILVDIPRGINNRVAYGKGNILIYFYVKGIGSYHTKDINTFNKLEDKFQEAISQPKTGDVYFKQNRVYTDYDQDRKFYINVQDIHIITK